MGQSLMARMHNMNRTMPAITGGKKDMGTNNSTANLASKNTATGMTMTGTNKQQQMSSTMFGTTGAFRNTAERGIVSGMGLLTF